MLSLIYEKAIYLAVYILYIFFYASSRKIRHANFISGTDYSELLGTDNSVNVASILNIPSTIENSEMHFFQDMSEILEIKHDSSSVSIDDGVQGNRLLVKDITNIKIHELQFVIDNHALDNGEGFKREYEVSKCLYRQLVFRLDI